MAVTTIPNVTNWTVTPQNGQAGYFTLMNTWLGQSTTVIASLQTAITAQNTANSEINALAIQTENNATLANGLANFQGAWNDAVTYLKGQSVESTSGSKIYYTSKVDSNLNHAVTDTTYWLYNPINDKLDKDINSLTNKTTPTDGDLFYLGDSTSLFSFKKLSWANIKATLKTYFDTLYMALTGNQSVDGVKTFTSSPIVPVATSSGQVISMGNIIEKTASAIGYGTGSGGTVTQSTNKTTAVALNKPTGQITMNNAALAANTEISFVLNNNLISGNDLVIAHHNTVSGVADGLAYRVTTNYTTTGAVRILVKNVSAGSLSEAIIINFEITKGANS